MKFAQIGLGSMGKRRIRNLLSHAIKSTDISGFDLSLERCKEVSDSLDIRTYKNFQELMATENPDALIISSPPDKHAEYFLEAAKRNKHFFVEISTTDDGYKELLEIQGKDSFIAAPSCTYQFYEPIQKIKSAVEHGTLGRILLFTHHTGQYLPNWHPYEDYRTFYGSKEHGAMSALIVFQLQWLSWTLGAQFGEGTLTAHKLLDLEIDSPDFVLLNVRIKNTLGIIVLDLLAKPAIRVLRIVGTEGTITWNWQERSLILATKDGSKPQLISLSPEHPLPGYLADEGMYEKEIGAFLHAIKGIKPFPYTFYDDYQHLAFIASLERKKLRTIRRRPQ